MERPHGGTHIALGRARIGNASTPHEYFDDRILHQVLTRDGCQLLGQWITTDGQSLHLQVTDEQVERLELIKRMKPLGLTINDMRTLLEAREVLRTAAADDGAPAKGGRRAAGSGRRKPVEAARYIETAVADMEEDADGWVVMGGIGNRLRNAYPDFDQRTYGYAKLSDLIRATGRFEVQSGAGGFMRVRRKG